MSVYKQPNSPYWLIEIEVDGRRFRRSSKTTSKRQAQRQEQQWRDELTAPPVPTAQPPMTLDEALTRYSETIVRSRNRPRSTEWEKYLIDRIRRDLGAGTLLPSITAARIANFSHCLLKAGSAPATVNRHLAILKAALRRAARDWGTLSQVPSITLLKLRNQRYRWLTEDEEKRLLMASASHLHDLLIFLLDTGARLSEATHLIWQDLQLERSLGEWSNSW